jgi:hypothetical protein
MRYSLGTGIAAVTSGTDCQRNREHGRLSLRPTVKGKLAEGDKTENQHRRWSGDEPSISFHLLLFLGKGMRVLQHAKKAVNLLDTRAWPRKV